MQKILFAKSAFLGGKEYFAANGIHNRNLQANRQEYIVWASLRGTMAYLTFIPRIFLYLHKKFFFFFLTRVWIKNLKGILIDQY